jgi:hypothetical protein
MLKYFNWWLPVFPAGKQRNSGGKYPGAKVK